MDEKAVYYLALAWLAVQVAVLATVVYSAVA